MNIKKWTFGEYKKEGGSWDRKVYANNPGGGFGQKGSTIYGTVPDDWVIDKICVDGDILNGKSVVTLHIICPFGD